MAFVQAATGRLLASHLYKFENHDRHLNRLCAMLMLFALVAIVLCYYSDTYAEELRRPTYFALLGFMIILPFGISYMQLYRKNVGG
jgi:hypothetical protein